MESVFSIVGLTLVAFAATNLDNLLLLVAIASRKGQGFAPIVAGALLTNGLMISLCLAAAFAADLAPQRWVGYLGVLPLALGVRELYRLATASSEPATESRGEPAMGATGVASVMLANSGDSLGALVPLFAETRDELLPLIGAVILLMSGLGCGLARWIASHPRIGPPVQRVGAKLVPFALIGVGLYVLSDTRTDTLLEGMP